MRIAIAAIALCLLAAMPSTVPSPGPSPGTLLPGILLEEVSGGCLAEAGLAAGAVLLAWRSEEEALAGGELRSPFDWDELRFEHGPRVAITLVGERAEGEGGEPFEVRVAPGHWNARARPRFAGEAAALAAAGSWEALASRALAAGDEELGAWLALQRGRQAAGERRWEEAVSHYFEALEWVRAQRLRVALWEAVGLDRTRAGDLPGAAAAFEELRRLREALPGPLALARSRYLLARTALERGDLEAAEAEYRRTLDLYEQHAPDSVALSSALIGAGSVAAQRGLLRQAEEHFRRSLAIRRRLAPDPWVEAGLYNNLGAVLQRRGDLRGARSAFELALELQRGVDPEDLQLGRILNNLGLLAFWMDDLDAAGDYLEQALAIKEREAPGQSIVASTLGNLGAVAEGQGDLDLAESHHRRALTLERGLNPRSPAVASALESLGFVELLRGRPREARELFEQAWEILEEVAPQGFEATVVWQRLAEAARDLGEVELAERNFRKALDIEGRLTAVSLRTVELWQQLGELALGEEQLPDHLTVAEGHFRQAIEVLEAQGRSLGGPQEQRARARARFDGLYRLEAEVLARLGRAPDAFDVQERARARTLLEMLAERDLQVPTAGVPGQEELDRERRRLAAAYEEVQGRLAAATEGERPPLRQQLRRLQRERQQVMEAMRAGGGLGPVPQPPPLGVEAVRKALAPGTLLLAYSVGRERTLLFALDRDHGLRLEVLAVGEERLQEEVARLHTLVRESATPSSALGARRLVSLRQAGRDLYQSLLAPVADAVEASQRLLILPDGPLQRLPFSLLVDAEDRYLVASRPLHHAVSATVYAQLRAAEAAGPGRLELAAFGAPKLPDATGPWPGSARRLALEPLPAARAEVEGLARHFPGSAVLVGAQATEERFKALGPQARYLHLATHAVLDERFPLESALVLAPSDEAAGGGGDNGLLQAWEIFEELQLDAELVVLSACESGLGTDLRGEGLLGLERAFQYAGARSVVASLWAVSDRTTAELMVRFYGYLRAGQSKDEALRSAQLDLLRGLPGHPDAAAPYHWAAFRLSGDWGIQ